LDRRSQLSVDPLDELEHPRTHVSLRRALVDQHRREGVEDPRLPVTPFALVVRLEMAIRGSETLRCLVVDCLEEILAELQSVCLKAAV
jgi:hypothetical protein